MSRLRTAVVALGFVGLVAVAQILVIVLLGWLTVLPVAFAGEGLPTPAGAEPVVSFHLGPLAMAAGAVAARLAGDVPLPVTALQGAEIAVYELDDDQQPPAGLLRAPGEDWVPVVRVRQDGERVGIFARIEGSRLRALDIVTCADGNLVRVRLTGHLDRAAARLLPWALEEAGCGHRGWDGFSTRCPRTR